MQQPKTTRFTALFFLEQHLVGNLYLAFGGRYKIPKVTVTCCDMPVTYCTTTVSFTAGILRYLILQSALCGPLAFLTILFVAPSVLRPYAPHYCGRGTFGAGEIFEAFSDAGRAAMYVQRIREAISDAKVNERVSTTAVYIRC